MEAIPEMAFSLANILKCWLDLTESEWKALPPRSEVPAPPRPYGPKRIHLVSRGAFSAIAPS